MRLPAVFSALFVLLAFPVATGARGDVSRVVVSLGTIQTTVVPTRHESPRLPRGRTGDLERITWSIRDRFGRTIGMGLFSCRWIVAEGRLCTGELVLPLGKISVTGSSPTRELGVYSVVGGTGRYVGAKGELTFRAIGSRKLVVSVTV